MMTNEEEEHQENLQEVTLNSDLLSSPPKVNFVKSKRSGNGKRLPAGLYGNGFTNCIFDLDNFKRDLSNAEVLSKLQESIVFKYYQLCCAQKMYLHGSLLGNYNSLFIAGTIEELIKISDAIRSSSLSTPLDEYEKWNNKLAGLEGFGVEVGILRRRLERLRGLAFSNPDREMEMKRLLEARAEKDDLQSKINQMRDTINSLDDDISHLQTKYESDLSTYHDEARASW